MRRIVIAEGTGTVKIKRRRGVVRHDGRYLGRVIRTTNGRWRDPSRPHLTFHSPAEAAESMVQEWN